MDRRSFIKNTAATGAAAFIGTGIFGREVLAAGPAKKADISVITGTDILQNTKEAVKMLGGMKKFVKKDSRVGILINSAFDTKGAYVHPDIALATLDMCFEARAREVVCLQAVDPSYWKRSENYDRYVHLFEHVTQVESNIFPAEFNEDDWVKMPGIQGAKGLKDVEVIKALTEVDVLINVFIAKHHAGANYTGALKNSMGYCTRKTNVFYHLGSGDRNNPEFLAQCIADINLLRQPDLIIGDATEFIISNGPGGPGDMIRLDKVFAGTNLVAMDALGVSYNDVDPEDVPVLRKAGEMGLGSADLSKINIVERA
ncbi:MAG: DUF362 domain-containing protein [Bacteroidales bacterium]|nr:DUF362 domain-containing protein [Bacteroidales bacterium]